jgi:hypothetical protein
MKKEWKKVKQGAYSFYVNDIVKGSMNTKLNSLNNNSDTEIDGNIFKIKRTGFWKSTVEVTDHKGQKVAKMYNENWYSSNSILEYKNKKYKIIVKNRPLAHWILTENNTELLSYGLTINSSKKKTVSISTHFDTNDYFFDFIMWYLFSAVAEEDEFQSISFIIGL